MYDIKVYCSPLGKEPFMEWLNKLPASVRAKVSARVSRLADGNLGDFKRVSAGLFEARIHLGPGFRIYFSIVKGQIILLLAAGDKGSQKRDIKNAKKYLADYLEVNDA